MTLIVHRCPHCNGQVKLKEEWNEGFCVYCGFKVQNDLLRMNAIKAGTVEYDEEIEIAIVKMAEEIIRSDVTEGSHIQKIKNTVLTGCRLVTDRYRHSEGKFVGDLEHICRRIALIPYEASKKTWDEVRIAANDAVNGCAICMAYAELSDSYIACMEKMEDLLKLKWSRKIPGFDKGELIELKKKITAAKTWLKYYSESD